MRRIGLIALLMLILLWGVLAIVLGSPSLDLSGGSGANAGAGVGANASSGGVSPACLPNTTAPHSARLADTDVDVSPEPGSGTANPHTQISFLGAPAADIHVVSVTGSRSGRHTGSLRAYSQGDGASFVPDAPFDSGEQVSVRARIGSSAGIWSGRPVTFSFRTDTPYPTAGVSEFPHPQAAPAEYESFATLPGVQAPIMNVTVADRDPAAGDIFTTNGPGPGQYGPLIYTPQGQLVFSRRLSGGETAEDLNEQTYAGRPALTWWRGRVLSLGFGQGEDVVMNSHYQTIARVPGGNGLRADLHEFQIEPHDVAYITAYNPIRCNLSSVHGVRDGAIIDNAIQEIDMRTGLVRWEWHTLDHIPVSESESETSKDSTPWDWFHLNSIDVEGEGESGSPGGDGGRANQQGDLFISSRNTWAGYQLEGGTGVIQWRLGGSHSSFKMGPGTRTAWQHDGRVLPDGIVTFYDDGSNPPIHRQSRGIGIELNFATHAARLAYSYTHPGPPLLAASQGNMQTLASGNAVVGYGAVPEITEFAPGGAVLFDAHLPYDMTFYRAYRHPWSATPAAPPAVAANLNNTGEETVVHASWNGATGVAAWRVLAGQHSDALAVQTTVPASGFETSTILPVKYAYVQVQSLDAAGNTLASSHTLAVSSYAASLPVWRESK